MNRNVALLLAGLLGGVAGGSLVWLTLEPSQPGSTVATHASVKRDTRSVSPPDENPVDTPSERTETAPVAQSVKPSDHKTGAPEPRPTVAESRAHGSVIDHTTIQTVAGQASNISSASLAAAKNASKGLDLSVSIEDVIVPIPSEVFAVLDKLGQPKWREAMRESDALEKRGQTKEQMALILGTVIAEGFIVIEAENEQALEAVGRNVLALSDALGVRRAVEKRCEAMIEAAKGNKWDRVRTELDGSLSDVKAAMIELNDEPIANLVSLGGWLRGTEALTFVVMRDDLEDAAELLHQPVLVEHFSNRLLHLPARMQSKLVAELQAALEQIRVLMGDGVAKLNQATVKGINHIVAKLIVRIAASERGG